MEQLNFKHLRYFWMVAKSGSVARASAALHLTPHAISGQIAQFEEALGVALFDRVGRRLVLTENGERILGLAEEIFALGDEIVELLRDPAGRQLPRLRIGLSDSVPKSVASRLLGPALRGPAAVRLICREGGLAGLLGDLALHRLDAVIADRPTPADLNVRAYNHSLGESALSVFGTPSLIECHAGVFPDCLNGAPFLMPGEEVAFRGELNRWFARNRIRPKVVAECDDLALLKAFGQKGAGFFVAPSAIAGFICRQYDVAVVGEVSEVREQLFLITTARRIVNPVLQQIRREAAREIFRVQPSEPPNGGEERP
jgi:LysR family transcriptional activator of nhaA